MAEARITFHPERRGDGSVAITETHWGYIVRELDGPADGAAVAETLLRFFGLVLVLAACAQWVLPVALFDAGPALGRPVLSAALAVCGAAIYFLVRRGPRAELQVDSAAREFRFVRGNAAGDGRILRRLPFDAVEGVVLGKGDESGAASVLLCLEARAEALRAACGDVGEIERLYRRLCRDLKTPAERVEARLKLAPPPRRLAVRAPMKTSA